MQEEIKKQMQDAMKARDELKLSVLRNILASFTNELVATKRTPQDKLSEEESLAVIKRLAKQRKESILQFNTGNRPELAEKEEKELVILEAYLPEMMSKEEILKIAEATKNKLGVQDKSKMGILIGAIMKELKGKADGKDVKEVIEGLF